MASSTDFHFRMNKELGEALRDAVKSFDIKGDRRRRGANPSVSLLVVAFIEMGLRRLDAGLPVVDAPSMAKKSARQHIPRRLGGGVYMAPLNTEEVYRDMVASPSVPTADMIADFDLDARRIEVDSAALLRGLVFTQDEGIRPLVGQRCTVHSVGRKRAEVRFGRKAASVHVYDLVPLPGKASRAEAIAECMGDADRRALLEDGAAERFFEALGFIDDLRGG